MLVLLQSMLQVRQIKRPIFQLLFPLSVQLNIYKKTHFFPGIKSAGSPIQASRLRKKMRDNYKKNKYYSSVNSFSSFWSNKLIALIKGVRSEEQTSELQ